MKTLVTGACRGIGYAICRCLAAAGHELLMLAKSPEQLKKSAEEIEKEFKVKTACLAQDLIAPGAAEAVKRFAKANAKGLHNLVLNAGIFREGDLKTGSREVLEEQMKVNFFSTFEMVQALLPLLDRSSPCRIVLIGSTAGLETSSTGAQYSVTKWALRGYAQNLRKELLKEKIAVTYVAPGGVYTDMWKYDGEDPELEKRLMKPDDVAKMVAAVVSLSGQADVEEIVVRPILGDLHN